MKARSNHRIRRHNGIRPRQDRLYVGVRQIAPLRLRPLLPVPRTCGDFERCMRLSRQGRLGDGGAVIWHGRILGMYHWIELECRRSFPVKLARIKWGRGRPYISKFEYRVGLVDSDLPF